jgi:8-oxo-dGTP pyrophosphatase MutT (NUDIX family)
MQKDLIPVEQGRWSSASWKFFITDEMPDEESVTAVFGVPMHPDGIALTCNHRGWELPGGHRELGETINEALAREILEETGITEFVSSEKPIGYLEIIDDAPKINKATGVPYPDPSYILFYAVATDGELAEPKGEEILDCKIFPLNNLPEIEGGTAKITLPHLILAAQRALSFTL